MSDAPELRRKYGFPSSVPVWVIEAYHEKCKRIEALERERNEARTEAASAIKILSDAQLFAELRQRDLSAEKRTQISLDNRPPGTDIEALKQESPDAAFAINWYEGHIEALERDVKFWRDQAGDNAKRSERTQITPELRERIAHEVEVWERENWGEGDYRKLALLRDLLAATEETDR